MNDTTVPVQLRRDRETGRPVLFFRNVNAQGRAWLECFDRAEGHGEASEGYRLACRPLDPAALPDDAAALLALWSSLPGGPPGRPVARLPIPCPYHARDCA